MYDDDSIYVIINPRCEMHHMMRSIFFLGFISLLGYASFMCFCKGICGNKIS